jgi:hypothetical protein
MSRRPATIPTDWEVRINNVGTPRAAWVLVRHHDGIGPVAESELKLSSAEPDSAVAGWVADSLEVTGTLLTPTERPSVWAVEIIE